MCGGRIGHAQTGKRRMTKTATNAKGTDQYTVPTFVSPIFALRSGNSNYSDATKPNNNGLIWLGRQDSNLGMAESKAAA